MARLRRVVLPGQPHLIIQRGQSGRAVFAHATDRDRYLQALRAGALQSDVGIHAYALLDNEVRLLVTPATATGLADMMQSVGRRYGRAFNQIHGRNGTVWEGRFRSTVIEASTQFRACLRFVETSTSGSGPAMHNKSAASSLGHHLGLRSDPWITEHPCYWAFGNTPFEREAAYRHFIEQAPAADDSSTIVAATINGWVLGSSEFVTHVGEATGRRPHPLARGRPRKRPAT